MGSQRVGHDRAPFTFISFILPHVFYTFFNPSKHLPECWRSRGLCVVLVLVTQSCPTLCDPMDCSPTGSSVRGILQARILEWVSMPSSRESSQPRDRSQVSRIAGRFFTVGATKEAQSPRIQEWVAYLFSRGSSLPRN